MATPRYDFGAMSAKGLGPITSGGPWGRWGSHTHRFAVVPTYCCCSSWRLWRLCMSLRFRCTHTHTHHKHSQADTYKCKWPTQILTEEETARKYTRWLLARPDEWPTHCFPLGLYSFCLDVACYLADIVFNYRPAPVSQFFGILVINFCSVYATIWQINILAEPRRGCGGLHQSVALGGDLEVSALLFPTHSPAVLGLVCSWLKL